VLFRIRSPFVVGSAGGLAALLGDFIWLLTDAVAEPYLHLSRQPFFLVIGLCFLASMALIGWSIRLYVANGYAIREARDELQHRRRQESRRSLCLQTSP
jgi:hypothetical protein